MLNAGLYQGRTKAASASSLLPLPSHSASLRSGENTQKNAGRCAKNTALALPMSLVFIIFASAKPVIGMPVFAATRPGGNHVAHKSPLTQLFTKTLLQWQK